MVAALNATYPMVLAPLDRLVIPRLEVQTVMVCEIQIGLVVIKAVIHSVIQVVNLTLSSDEVRHLKPPAPKENSG